MISLLLAVIGLLLIALGVLALRTHSLEKQLKRQQSHNQSLTAAYQARLKADRAIQQQRQQEKNQHETVQHKIRQRRYFNDTD